MFSNPIEKEHGRGKGKGIDKSEEERKRWEESDPEFDDEWSQSEPPGGSAGGKGYKQPHNIDEADPDPWHRGTGGF